MEAGESGRKARTLIVDDDFYARDAMRTLLSRDSRANVWGEAADVTEAVELIEAASRKREPLPDVVVLDIRLHDSETGGIDGLPDLKAASPDTRVLVCSVVRDEDTILAALEAGADGYVWKNESAEGIADAVARIAEGRFIVTRSVAERIAGGIANLAREAAEVLPERKAVDLSDAVRRTAYLYCICAMSAREIADELQVSVHTVNSRIRLAYEVLGATSRREAFEMLISAEERA